jgi:hypothetical protein
MKIMIRNCGLIVAARLRAPCAQLTQSIENARLQFRIRCADEVFPLHQHG